MSGLAPSTHVAPWSSAAGEFTGSGPAMTLVLIVVVVALALALSTALVLGRLMAVILAGLWTTLALLALILLVLLLFGLRDA